MTQVAGCVRDKNYIAKTISSDTKCSIEKRNETNINMINYCFIYHLGCSYALIDFKIYFIAHGWIISLNSIRVYVTHFI